LAKAAGFNVPNIPDDGGNGSTEGLGDLTQGSATLTKGSHLAYLGVRKTSSRHYTYFSTKFLRQQAPQIPRKKTAPIAYRIVAISGACHSPVGAALGARAIRRRFAGLLLLHLFSRLSLPLRGIPSASAGGHGLWVPGGNLRQLLPARGSGDASRYPLLFLLAARAQGLEVGALRPQVWFCESGAIVGRCTMR